MRSSLPSIILVLTLAMMSAGPAVTGAGNGDVALWGRWEGVWQAQGAAPQTRLWLNVRSPDGEVRTIEGFWDGESSWRARIMPDQPGRWEWKSRSEPVDAGLHDKTGSFECRRGAGAPIGERFLRHGAIRVSPQGSHLTHADGTPFFWLADTAWNGPLLADGESWSTYLRDRARREFSAVQVVMTQWRTAPSDSEGQVAFTGREKIEINPRFFQRMDLRMDAINRHNLLAAPVLLWAIGGGGDAELNPGASLPEDQAIRLARYMAARYGAHHVVWMLAGDANYSGANGEKWKRIGRAVFDDTRRQAPALLHPQGMQWHLEQYREEPWNQIFGYQSGHGDDAAALSWMQSGPPSVEWRRRPRRPVINLEPPYEGHIAYQSGKPHDAFNVRRAAYWSLLNAPTAGVSYGAHGIWSWQTARGVPRNHPRSGEAPPWNEALDYPGARQMTILARFFQSIPWWRLAPSPELAAHQPGAEDPSRFISAASLPAHEIALFYTPVQQPIQLKPDTSILRHKAQWINPRTGRRQRARLEQLQFLPPADGDWLLLLRK